MKFVLALLALLSLPAAAHDPTEGPVALEPEALRSSAGRIHYEFQLVETATNKLVTDRELNVVHEKKLHLLAYDPALREFHHVHPEFNGTLWTVDLDVPVNGEYYVWAQGELSANHKEFTAGNRLSVSGGRPAWPANPALRDQRSGVSGTSRAALSSTRLQAGRMAMLTLSFTRTDGSKPEITPYLGAFAHAVIVPDDGDSLIHVHPMDGGSPTEGMLHLTFPQKGLYRVWVQFQDAGSLKTIPMAVEVF